MTDRREFFRGAALGVSGGLLGANASAIAAAPAGDLTRYLVNPGPKETLRGLKAAVSTQSAITTETVMKVLRAGGGAVDAAIAGCMVQAAIEPYQSNHTGTVSFLYYEAKSGSYHQLDSTGTFPGGIAPYYPGAAGEDGYTGGRLSTGPSAACIPGFMPGMKAMFEKFGTRPWASLCEDAIRWAEEGHPVSSVEYGSYSQQLDALTYYPESRRFFMPQGHLIPVGQRFASRDMAATLRAVAAEGPDHMISGAWASRFVAIANEMGWKINKKHMTETPPRWLPPLRFKHQEYEIVGLAAPQQQGIFCAVVLGILRHLGIRELEPQSAGHLIYMSHALRWALYHCGYLGDPVVAEYATDTLLSDDLHAAAAKLIRGLDPKIDLSKHVDLTRGGGIGIPTGEEIAPTTRPSTCELSIVDSQGNWVQMTHTLQSGGIPNMVIGGIPMSGSNALFTGIAGDMDAKLVAGTRMRRALGSTFVLRDGKPVYSLGTPGNVYFTVPQVLTNLLDFKQDPYAAIDAPRLQPLSERGMVTIEDRIAQDTVKAIRARGVGVQVLPAYQWAMGAFQMCFRDEHGRLGTTTDPRRCGVSGGLR
jgi:gamma-glutamyltranspeptidase/glutathione hydrolase